MHPPVRIDRGAIAALIPHQGAMCLLDAIEAWSADEITARSTTHRMQSNPLREHDGLPATAAIEYAAQAIAVHGGLLAREQGGRARPGYLVAVRDVRISVGYLDRVDADLEVRATRVVANATGLMYTFIVAAADQTLVSGRATVTLETPLEGVSR